MPSGASSSWWLVPVCMSMAACASSVHEASLCWVLSLIIASSLDPFYAWSLRAAAEATMAASVKNLISDVCSVLPKYYKSVAIRVP